jgi:homoserine dehydrogenase
MELTLMGPGAGGAATAAAVVADLMDLARGRRVPTFGRPAAALAKPQRAPMQRHEGGYYIRLAVVDRPGTAATIAQRMADEKISLESIMQHGRDRRPHGGEDPRRVDKPALVVLITYATTEDAVRRALAAIEQDGVWVEKPQVIRIEKS